MAVTRSDVSVLPTVTVCIPAFRRARYLAPLLESLVSQSAPPYQVVICEDGSDERPDIARIVDEYRGRLPIAYFENSTTLGYDANVRRCISVADGDYCLMMGNDDLLDADAIRRISGMVQATGPIGVIGRAYRIFKGSPANIVQDIRHFPSDRVFQAGRDAIVALYRRTGVLSGLTFQREAARALASDRWDGTLYYQMYLASNLLATLQGAYIASPLVLCRDGVPPDFGVSAVERRFFTPGRYTSGARVRMFGAMVDIIADLQSRTSLPILKPVLRDLGAYSYYLLAGQPHRPAGEFVRYYIRLGRIGIRRHFLYHVYFLSLLIMGEQGSRRLIESIRRVVGRSPNLSNIPEGTSICR